MEAAIGVMVFLAAFLGLLAWYTELYKRAEPEDQGDQ